jgi:hypothetical protein
VQSLSRKLDAPEVEGVIFLSVAGQKGAAGYPGVREV